MAEIEIQGMKEAQAKVEQMVADLQGNELEQGVRDATLLVTRDAKILSPVDTGRLRASILPRVKVTKLPPAVKGFVGSKVKYAPFQEERVGYLAKAFEKNLDRIKQLIDNVVAKIVSR